MKAKISEETKNNKWYQFGMSGIKTFVVVILVSAILAVIIILVDNYQREKKLEALTNPYRLLNNVYEIQDEKIKIDMPDDMVILTKEEIANFWGSEYSEVYDCMAVSSDFEKKILIFTDEKTNYEEKYSAEEYLKMGLGEDAVEIKKLEINDYNFYYVEQKYTDLYNNKTYNSNTYALDLGEKFLCIIIDKPEDVELKVEEILKF